MDKSKISRKRSSLIDQGFGTTAKYKPNRLVNANGSFNVRHKNRRFALSRGYHYFVNIGWPKFILLIFGIYVAINFIFGLVYTFCGIDEIAEHSEGFWSDVWNGFFFSAQTITTVGYGALAPEGQLASWISSFEALLGLLFFVFVTGILYGRFSKPEASLRFSKSIIHRPFRDGNAIMFRLMNSMPTVMITPKATVTLALHIEMDDGSYALRYFPLKLQLERVNFLPTTWTLVHQIEGDSPLKDLTIEEIKELEGEFLIMIEYFDETYDQHVYQIHSYLTSEIQFGVKFVKAYYNDKDGTTVLDHGLLSATEPMTA